MIKVECFDEKYIRELHILIILMRTYNFHMILID